MPFVCTLHDWVYTFQNDEIDIILKVLGVFMDREGAIGYAQSFDLGESGKWIEVHKFNGTECTKIGEMDRSG